MSGKPVRTTVTEIEKTKIMSYLTIEVRAKTMKKKREKVEANRKEIRKDIVTKFVNQGIDRYWTFVPK